MLKLNEIRDNNKIKAYGFEAFVDYAVTSKGDNEVVISTLSPAVMADMGIKSYFAPVLTRGVVFNTAEDVEQADLEVNCITVLKGLPADMFKHVLIVSRHQGTIDLLKDMYHGATVISGNVASNDIDGQFVVGTLPPHLIQYCKSYQAVVVDNFDYSKDGDLSGQALHDRIHICDPIAVTIK